MRCDQAIVLLLNLLSFSPMMAQSSGRSLVEVFDYASDLPESASRPASWLAPKINRTVEDAHGRHPQLVSLVDVKVKEVKDPYPGSVGERAEFWSNSTKVLLFLNGEMYLKELPPRIVSNAYLGDDKGVFPNPMITVRSDLTAESDEVFNNLHCALTLYALAMDASRTHAKEADVEGYLEEVTRLLGSTPIPTVTRFDEVRNTLVKAATDELDALKRKYQRP